MIELEEIKVEIRLVDLVEIQNKASLYLFVQKQKEEIEKKYFELLKRVNNENKTELCE